MQGKIIPFDKNVNRYRRKADGYADKGNFMRALAFLNSAKSMDCNLDVLVDLADAYADMGLLELSNKYWFKFMDKAPKDKISTAYEELAINYFYLDNYWASSYYFHQKLSVDGHIAKEGLSQEIIDFFSGEEQRRLAYRVVYPYHLADFSLEIKKAKHAMILGAFEEGQKFLSAIPKECRTEENSGDLAVCYFMCEDFENAIKECKFSLEKHGETVTAYCNLSTVYDMKEDFDKSEFYYRKALSCAKGEKTETYKLATCAIEREDHQMAADCLKAILEDRPYENAMRFFYGLSLANLGKYEYALNELKKAYAINDEDVVVKYYHDYVQDLLEQKGDYQNLTPFKYVKELPEKIAKEWEAWIVALSVKPEKVDSVLKREQGRRKIVWGLRYGKSEIMRNCVYILSLAKCAYAKQLMLDLLLDPECGEELKRVLIYVLIMQGVKSKTGIVAGNYYMKLKPGKLACEKDARGALYTSAYALCISRILFYEVKDVDKIAKTCDKVYKKFRSVLTEAEVTNEELASLILSESKLERFSEEREVLKLFSVEANKLRTLKKLYKGEKND